MKLGDLLLLKGHINKRQLTSALSKQADEAITYNRSVPLGKILIEMGHISVDEVSEVLNEQQQEIKEVIENKKEKVMPTEIGENSKFTFDLKFIATIGAVIVSACATYFSIQGSISELKSNNSPNRLEHEYVVKEIDDIKETFTEIKNLSTTLTPLAANLNEIKLEIAKLKNKKPPEIDLSDVEYKLDNLSGNIDSLKVRIIKLENKKDGGRF